MLTRLHHEPVRDFTRLHDTPPDRNPQRDVERDEGRPVLRRASEFQLLRARVSYWAWAASFRAVAVRSASERWRSGGTRSRSPGLLARLGPRLAGVADASAHMCALQVREEPRSDAPEGARGNHLGGVGVVFVMQRDGRPVKEISRSRTSSPSSPGSTTSSDPSPPARPSPWFTTTTASPSG